MNNAQNKMFELLQKFDCQARKFGITYYLGGGTALGAVRHGGFLPWDDDADLYISRDNYEKLLAVQDQFFSEDFVLVNHEEYPRYGNTLVRCVDTKSTAITKARIADGTPKGQFIEMFILDPMPKDPEKQDEWKTKHWVHAELMGYTFRVANVRNEKWVNKDLYDEYVNKCATVGKEQVLAQLEDELFSVPESEAKEYCARWGFRYLVYDIDWFGEPRYVTFENAELPVASRVEKVLRFDYGDGWKYIPKGKEQITHSMAENDEIGYKNFEADYSQFVDVDQVYEAYGERKEKLMNYYFVNLEAKKARRELKETQVITSLQYNLKSYEELERLAADGDWSSLEDFFKIWRDNQYSACFWKAGKCIGIDDTMLYYAILPILMQGGYSDVSKLLSWRQEEQALTDKLQQILDFADCIRDVYIAIDDEQDYAAAKKLLRADAILAFADRERQYDYQKLKVEIAFHTLEDKAELSQVEKACEKLITVYPDQGEVIALYGDIKYQSGQTAEAETYYKQAYTRTQNGLVRKHIEDRVGLSVRTETGV